MGPPQYPHVPDLSIYQNQHYGAMVQSSSSPNLFHPHPNPTRELLNSAALDWQLVLANWQLYTIPAATVQPTGAASMFNPEEQDKTFTDPNTDSNDDGKDSVPRTAREEPGPIAPVLPVIGAVTQDHSQFTTPQNFRTFPRATPNMSSTNIKLAPQCKLVHCTQPAYTNLSPPSNLSSPSNPLQSPAVTSQKENAVHLFSDDESVEPAPPKKKSRKEQGARSIKNIDPKCVSIIKKAYNYIAFKVLTDEDKAWLQGRTELATFVQEAVDWAIHQLKLNPDDFGPCRDRIYGTQREFKEVAHIIVAGPDEFEFHKCSTKALKEEQDHAGAGKHALVAKLMDRSAFVFADPYDRTVKGSMYKHASIGVLICDTLFTALLSLGMQYLEAFDDAFPEVHNDMAPPHRPTLSLVTLAIAITALRVGIMEYSSGHFLAEEFLCKVYKAHFDAELNTLQEWHRFTSNPTLIPGSGPVHMAPPTFLT
ncbi:hypothetical protein B0H10DRAFT_1948576 [Mycena sp. CBHHK59/15]|nr:hypothetical protein B0H10DRAFT_1948576 [Mycena sp. CBHHK59/15]